MKYEDIATTYQDSVPVGGGMYFIKIRWHPEDLTTDKIPGLSSLLNYLDNNYEPKNASTSNQSNNRKLNYISQENNSNYVKKFNNITLKKNSYYNQDVSSSYVKQNIQINTTTRKVPIMIIIEHSFYYVKKNRHQTNILQQEINNIKSFLNI